MENPKHRLIAILSVAAAYLATGKLGLTLAFVHPSATAVWPPTGIALGALLLFGYDVWPGVFAGALVVNLMTVGSVLTCLGIAAGNTLECLVGAYLVNRFANGRRCMERTQDIFKFAIYAGIFSTAISATIGYVSLAATGYARWSDLGRVWPTWWLGDAVGAVVIAPLVLLWATQRPTRWREGQFLEAAGLIACLLLVGYIVFARSFVTGGRGYPLEYLCIPFLMWAAFRFGQREAATATLILAACAIWGTFRGFGPFAIGTPSESFALLQAFIGVVAVMTLALAAQFAERQRAEEQARMLAGSDPLTGLGNYRKLIDALEGEMRRSDRTGRSFAFLLMDLDGLKQINDTFGHQVGNRALCRLAHVLRLHSRGIDTAARFGGDEFALIIPEAGAKAARQVAQRIAKRLAEDGEQPPLSVSVGAATWPEDGETMDTLLQSADRNLYEKKRLPQHKAVAERERSRRLDS